MAEAGGERRAVGRRLAGLAILAVVLVIGARLFTGRAVEVTLDLALDGAAVGLGELDVALYRGGGGGGEADRAPDAELVIRYAKGAAPADDVAHLRLARGHYRVAVRLDYGSHARAVDRAIDVEGEGEIALRL